MIAVKTWEQTLDLDPTNPQQRIREVLAWPGDGGYTSIYFNPVTPGAKPLGAVTWAGLPSWGQSLIVAGLAATAGYFGMRRYGDRYVKPALRRFGIGK